MFKLGADFITTITTRITSCAQATAPPMVNGILIWLSHSNSLPWLNDFQNQESIQMKASTHYSISTNGDASNFPAFLAPSPHSASSTNPTTPQYTPHAKGESER